MRQISQSQGFLSKLLDGSTFEAMSYVISNPRIVGENSILGLLTKGIIEPTPMYGALDAYMGEFKPGLVELDVLADLFSGDENNRPQVTQFVGLLKRLCRKHHCAILLLAQPSVVGMNTGSGTSAEEGRRVSSSAGQNFAQASRKQCFQASRQQKSC